MWTRKDQQFRRCYRNGQMLIIIISPHCDPDLEDSKAIFLHDTPAQDNVSPCQVWSQKINSSEDIVRKRRKKEKKKKKSTHTHTHTHTYTHTHTHTHTHTPLTAVFYPQSDLDLKDNDPTFSQHTKASDDIPSIYMQKEQQSRR